MYSLIIHCRGHLWVVYVNPGGTLRSTDEISSGVAIYVNLQDDLPCMCDVRAKYLARFGSKTLLVQKHVFGREHNPIWGFLTILPCRAVLNSNGR
jgi:hypothetical protein